MASSSGSGSDVEDPAPGSEVSFSSSANLPLRRGPVVVSSDEESELERQPVRPPRAPSRTPSWAKSSISPSPVPVPIQRTEPFGIPSRSEARSRDTRRRGRSNSANRSVFSTERLDSRGPDSAVSDSVASRGTLRWGSVFGSDLEQESDSGDSGRIRNKKVGWMSPSWSLLSPSGSAAGGRGEESDPGSDDSDPGSDDDSGGEPELEVCLSTKISSSEHGSTGNDGDLGPKTPSGSRSSSDSGVEETLFVSPDEHLEMLGSPSGTDFSGSGTEGWHSAASEAEEGPEIGLSDEDPASPPPAVQVPNPSQPRPIKIKGRRRGKQIDMFNPKYVELLNKEIILASRGVNDFRESTVARGGSHASGRYADKESWIFGSVWTVNEKDMLFKHLSIVGKDNVAELARRIGTKSIVECRAYLKALQDGSEDNMDSPISQSSNNRDLISMKDIPAAIELTDECAEALEEEADALESRTLRDEERREKVKWGKYWLLESTTSLTIGSLYKNKDIEGIKRIAPEAELLNIYTMIELSESIFMNGLANNWQELSAEPPSIRHTALADIHTLVVSLTRRIVQTTIFMAMSRLRGMESKIFGQHKQIRPVDVEAAINCLHLPQNSKEYWLKVPRRVGLRVFNRKEDIRKRSDVGYIPYDELERLLRGSQVMGGSFSSISGQEGAEKENEVVEATMDSLIASAYVECGLEEEAAEDLVNTGISSSDTDTIDDHDDHESIVDDAGQGYQSKFQKKRDARLKVFDDAEDLYMEAMDQKQSLKAEKALWRIMGKEPSKHLPKKTGELPKVPPKERKRTSEVMDWRDDVDYLEPWETIKRRKIKNVEEIGEAENATATSDIHSAEPLLKLQTVIGLQKPEANPWKPTVKNRGQMKTKKSPVPAHSPKKPRTRRQSKIYSGYVPTVENVFESDEEALAREGQVGNSSSEVHSNC